MAIGPGAYFQVLPDIIVGAVRMIISRPQMMVDACCMDNRLTNLT
ncbi:MAG: hypothetical protein QGI86_00755 [Candidatus Poribacteria bacterium]|nr:hypothetical protein [Candidatus Poribacteria bacterium]MDP6747418.1 hypothetical protein [Candidatus Poribacteria bacterium]MDP6998632.1 hypothetical protein [Candidatus Poribacteria bacterium]